MIVFTKFQEFTACWHAWSVLRILATFHDFGDCWRWYMICGFLTIVTVLENSSGFGIFLGRLGVVDEVIYLAWNRKRWINWTRTTKTSFYHGLKQKYLLFEIEKNPYSLLQVGFKISISVPWNHQFYKNKFLLEIKIKLILWNVPASLQKNCIFDFLKTT